MNLYILRHAIAVEHGAPGYEDKDSERPLTREGKERLGEVIEAMKKLELRFDVLISSPLVRTRQTAEMVAKEFRTKTKLIFSEHLAPEGSPEKLIAELQTFEGKEGVMLVGHEPYLSLLISLLASGDAELDLTLKKAGLCKLTAETFRPGKCATLEWLLTPKQMALLT